MDLLINEINNLALATQLIIVVTSKPNIMTELSKTFKIYTLNQLSENQVKNISYEVLGYNTHILHETNQNLRVLLHNPSFLSMYLLFIKNNPRNFSKPENLTSVYNYYIKYFLTTRLLQKGIENSYSIESLKQILALFAYNLTEGKELNSNIDKVILSILPQADITVLHKILIGSTIVQEYDGIIDFQFETVKEYFYSIHLASLQHDDIIKYIDENAENEKSVNIILLMVGNLTNEDYQNKLLDYLESNNFSLYIKCLNTRFRFSNKYMENFSEIVCQNLFKQIIISYENIVRTHFSNLIDFFAPWIDLDEKDCYESVIPHISGGIDLETLYIDVYIEGAAEEQHNNRVKINYSENKHPFIIREGEEKQFAKPILSLSDGVRNFGYDLRHFFNGVDCAREIAAKIVYQRLEKILEEKILLFSEHAYTQCEYLETCLNVLPQQVIQEVLKAGKAKLSLRTASLDEIRELFRPVNNLVYNSGILKNQKVDFGVVWVIANALSQSDVNPLFVLPPEKEYVSAKSYWIWEVYTINSIKEWITRYYEAYQTSYRYFVNALFPTLKKDMPLYYSGPVQYQIEIYTNDDENQLCSKDYRVRVLWEAKQTEDECHTKVSIINKSDKKPILDDDFFEKSRKKLKFLGRKGYGLGISEHGISLYIGSPNDNYTIRNRMYKEVLEGIKIIFNE